MAKQIANQSQVQGTTLGYAQVTATQGPITTSVDLTGLSVTVTVPSGGRRVRVTVYCNNVYTGTANSRAYTTIQEGSTVLGASRTGVPVVGTAIVTSWIGTPTAGSHTYKATAACDAGVSVNYYADSTSVNYIHVELV